MLTLVLRKVLDFSDLPQEWSVVRLAADWHGQPIVLIAEGKPERPKPPCDAEGWETWRRAPPRAHHVLCLEDGALRQVRLEDSGGPFTFNVQPVEDGWLVGERWARTSRNDCRL